MAILARLDAQATNGPKVVTNWSFRSTTGPFEPDGTTPRVIHRQDLAYDPTTPDLIAKMSADLLVIGGSIQAALTVSASLTANVPVGTELQVG